MTVTPSGVFLFMKTIAPFFLTLVLYCPASAQKTIKKIVADPNERFFEINTENCFRVDLCTTDSNELEVEASMEGEYQKDLVVKIEEDGQRLSISTAFLPSFVLPNDKLSAHKVISIALKVTVPENVQVTLFGTTSDLYVTGAYRTLKAVLSEGNCVLTHVTENVDIKTFGGNISVSASEGVFNAKSNYGKVVLDEFPKGNSIFRLNSIKGDILVKRTE